MHRKIVTEATVISETGQYLLISEGQMGYTNSLLLSFIEQNFLGLRDAVESDLLSLFEQVEDAQEKLIYQNDVLRSDNAQLKKRIERLEGQVVRLEGIIVEAASSTLFDAIGQLADEAEQETLPSRFPGSDTYGKSSTTLGPFVFGYPKP